MVHPKDLKVNGIYTDSQVDKLIYLGTRTLRSGDLHYMFALSDTPEQVHCVLSREDLDSLEEYLPGIKVSGDMLRAPTTPVQPVPRQVLRGSMSADAIAAFVSAMVGTARECGMDEAALAAIFQPDVLRAVNTKR